MIGEHDHGRTHPCSKHIDGPTDPVRTDPVRTDGCK